MTSNQLLVLLIAACAACTPLRPKLQDAPAPYMGDNYQLILIA